MENEHNSLRNLKFNEAACFTGIQSEADLEFEILSLKGKAQQYTEMYEQTGIPFYDDCAKAYKHKAELLEHPELTDTFIQQNLS